MSSPVFGTAWALQHLLTERLRANSCRVATGARAEIGELEGGGVLAGGGVLFWVTVPVVSSFRWLVRG